MVTILASALLVLVLLLVDERTPVTAGTTGAEGARVTVVNFGKEPAPEVVKVAAPESNELAGTMAGITPAI